MRRDDICLYLGPADRAQLEALCANRNTARKVVWRAEIVLATADGCGTSEIMRRAQTSKPTVWRWQERYLDEGVAGLRRDKTRPSRVPPLPRETRLKVIAKAVREAPPEERRHAFRDVNKGYTPEDARCDAVEPRHDGRSGGDFAVERRPHLGG